jgi:hypothetical protein
MIIVSRNSKKHDPSLSAKYNSPIELCNAQAQTSLIRVQMGAGLYYQVLTACAYPDIASAQEGYDLRTTSDEALTAPATNGFQTQ